MGGWSALKPMTIGSGVPFAPTTKWLRPDGGLDEIKRLAAETETIDPKTLDIVQKYDDEEFFYRTYPEGLV